MANRLPLLSNTCTVRSSKDSILIFFENFIWIPFVTLSKYLYSIKMGSSEVFSVVSPGVEIEGHVFPTHGTHDSP